MSQKDPILPTNNSLNEKKSIKKRDSNEETSVEYAERVPITDNVNARLVNPLQGYSQEELAEMGRGFAKKFELGHLEEVVTKGAIVAQDPMAFEHISLLTEEDKAALRFEITHKWRQPKELYFLVVACSMAAAVQGVGPRP